MLRKAWIIGISAGIARSLEMRLKLIWPELT
jgi:hypothetical protein